MEKHPDLTSTLSPFTSFKTCVTYPYHGKGGTAVACVQMPPSPQKNFLWGGGGGVCTQASNAVVCYTAVFLGALRDDTKNGCVAD